MSGTISRVSSALFRQHRPSLLRLHPNYASSPQTQVKQAAEGAKEKLENMASKTKMSKEEIVGWIFMGIVAYAVVKRIVFGKKKK